MSVYSEITADSLDNSYIVRWPIFSTNRIISLMANESLVRTYEHVKWLKTAAISKNIPFDNYVSNWDSVQQNHPCDTFSNVSGQAKEK